MTNKKMIISLCLVMIFVGLATGCKPRQRPTPLHQQQNELKETAPGLAPQQRKEIPPGNNR